LIMAAFWDGFAGQCSETSDELYARLKRIKEGQKSVLTTDLLGKQTNDSGSGFEFVYTVQTASRWPYGVDAPPYTNLMTINERMVSNAYLERREALVLPRVVFPPPAPALPDWGVSLEAAKKHADEYYIEFTKDFLPKDPLWRSVVENKFGLGNHFWYKYFCVNPYWETARGAVAVEQRTWTRGPIPTAPDIPPERALGALGVLHGCIQPKTLKQCLEASGAVVAFYDTRFSMGACPARSDGGYGQFEKFATVDECAEAYCGMFHLPLKKGI